MLAESRLNKCSAIKFGVRFMTMGKKRGLKKYLSYLTIVCISVLDVGK